MKTFFIKLWREGGRWTWAVQEAPTLTTERTIVATGVDFSFDAATWAAYDAYDVACINAGQATRTLLARGRK